MFDWLRRATRPATNPTLEDRVAAIEKQLKAIDVEWSEWYDKYRRLLARISKRVERDEKLNAEENGASDEKKPLRFHEHTRTLPRSMRGF